MGAAYPLSYPIFNAEVLVPLKNSNAEKNCIVNMQFNTVVLVALILWISTNLRLTVTRILASYPVRPHIVFNSYIVSYVNADKY